MILPLILGIFLLIALYIIFWYITIPVTIIIIVIIWLSSRDNAGKKKKKDDEFRRSIRKRSIEEAERRDNLVRYRLERFDLSEEEAELIFGKKWRTKLSSEHYKLFDNIVKKKLDLLLPSKVFRKKVFHIIDKVIRMIDSVYNEDPKFAKEWESKSEKRFTGSYGFSYSFISLSILWSTDDK